METINMMSIEDIKNLTAISDNVSPALLQPFIKNAEMMYIKPVLGDALYNNIILSLSTGGTFYENLLQGYVFYALAYYTFYNYLPFSAYKIQKKGVVKQHSDDSENVDTEELSLLIKRVESMAVSYTNMLRDYLNGSGGLIYTLYRKSDCSDDNHTQGNSIFLPKTSRGYHYNPKLGNWI